MDIFYSIQVNIRQVVTSDLLFKGFGRKVGTIIATVLQAIRLLRRDA